MRVAPQPGSRNHQNTSLAGEQGGRQVCSKVSRPTLLRAFRLPDAL